MIFRGEVLAPETLPRMRNPFYLAEQHRFYFSPKKKSHKKNLNAFIHFVLVLFSLDVTMKIFTCGLDII